MIVFVVYCKMSLVNSVRVELFPKPYIVTRVINLTEYFKE